MIERVQSRFLIGYLFSTLIIYQLYEMVSNPKFNLDKSIKDNFKTVSTASISDFLGKKLYRGYTRYTLCTSIS
jgi:hypothetical protein